ncbi:hypothetical protein H0H81_008796 [Sphagnurus paluster]|uniref:Uncharacterized protein n=1 Tax=Sphagnurus paluster TaxID=117069 RepID=A0A9P7FYJ4_9AGAR|nr:hypothetical protein H0H81_008796 [Sphagnurus paluster]
MPSRRSRSRSPRRERSQSPEKDIRLPNNASPISESDYFQKSDEFRSWLKDEKGKLPESLYSGIDPSTVVATTQTAYKWSFASKKSRADEDALRAAREEISAATYNREAPSQVGSSRGRVQGPTLPSASDLALSRENAAEQWQEEYSYKRKRDKLEAKERVEEMVGPREVGREGMLEKKRARREADRNFREKGDEGLEIDESTLLGGGDSFKAQIARRDATKQRYSAAQEERAAAARERASMFKQKEQATMDMFQQMVKQRFG